MTELETKNVREVLNRVGNPTMCGVCATPIWYIKPRHTWQKELIVDEAAQPHDVFNCTEPDPRSQMPRRSIDPSQHNTTQTTQPPLTNFPIATRTHGDDPR